MSSVSCSPAPAIPICQESFNDLKKIFTFDRNKNNLYNNAVHFIPLATVKEWHWEWFYIGPICLSAKNFDTDIHSLSFNPLPPVDFPFSDMRVQTSCRQNVQISAGIACGRTPCANSTGNKILCDKGWLKMVCSSLFQKLIAFDQYFPSSF